MKSNEPDWLDHAESILDQLLKFTAQLAEIEQDPGVDAKALAQACTRRLDDLKRIIAPDLKVLQANNDVLEKMRELYSRTQVCLEILGRKSNRAATDLQGLTRTKQAMSAYSAQRACKS